MRQSDVTTPMIKAGMEAAVSAIPPETLSARGIDPAKLAVDIFLAMAGRMWRPIASAPRTQENVMLALMDEKGFAQGIGCWVPPDDDSHGAWSTESWWGKPPTHWMPMLAPPPAPAGDGKEGSA